jgi:archaeal flagellar protein FlaJ
MFRKAKTPIEAWKTEAAPAAAPTAPHDPFVKRYRAFCYGLIGQRLDTVVSSDLLAEQLKQAGMSVTPGMHRAVEIVTALIALVVSFVVSLILFRFVLHSSDWYAYVGLLTVLTVGTVFAGFRFLLSSRIETRKDRIERELPFTFSELSVLASTGTSPIELVRRMSRRKHDPAMSAEFGKVAYKTDIQGKDLITALAETAKEAPSLALREAFWDLANMIHQGGNLDEYLRTKSEEVLVLKRIAQKSFIERLQTYVDMYVTLVLVGVLMGGVGAFLLNTLGQTSFGLDSNAILLLLAFGVVPVAVAMTSILISMAYARAEAK